MNNAQTLGKPQYDINILKRLVSLNKLNKKDVRNMSLTELQFVSSEINHEINSIMLREELINMLDILESENKLETLKG